LWCAGSGVVGKEARFQTASITPRRVHWIAVRWSTRADGVLALADGKLLSEKSSDTNSVTFEMPDHAKQVTLLYENRGLQQHTTPTLEKNWLNGIRGVKSGETVLPV
jgi:hypothetical protein